VSPARPLPNRFLISSGSPFESEIGYSRAVVDGEWIFLSGCTGYDYTTMQLADGVVAQCEQAMRNIEATLREAGASMADVVRVHYFLPRREDFKFCWPVLKTYFSEIRPAATMLQTELMEPEMLIEIEGTARRLCAG
jgi:enamine deaminase RidA (YjgF/YER057c/UK114 family)